MLVGTVLCFALPFENYSEENRICSPVAVASLLLLFSTARARAPRRPPRADAAVTGETSDDGPRRDASTHDGGV